MSDLWDSLLLSLGIATLATLAVAVVGVPLAYLISRRRFPGRSVIEAVITVPLVLPPTVVGYFILVTLGARGPIGSLLRRASGYSVLFQSGYPLRFIRTGNK